MSRLELENKQKIIYEVAIVYTYIVSIDKVFDLSVYYMFLQYFDTVSWVFFWPVKTVSHITHTVFEGT